MTKGDTVKIHRGPLSGMDIVLHRRDAANRAWYGRLAGGWRHKAGAEAELDGLVLVFESDLTIERKRKKRGA
jgi:hypothetical protein